MLSDHGHWLQKVTEKWSVSDFHRKMILCFISCHICPKQGNFRVLPGSEIHISFTCIHVHWFCLYFGCFLKEDKVDGSHSSFSASRKRTISQFIFYILYCKILFLCIVRFCSYIYGWWDLIFLCIVRLCSYIYGWWGFDYVVPKFLSQ